MVCRTHLWTFSGCFIGFATFKKLVPTIHNLLLVIKHIYQKNISWLVRDEDMVLNIAWFVIAAGLASMTMQIGQKKTAPNLNHPSMILGPYKYGNGIQY